MNSNYKKKEKKYTATSVSLAPPLVHQRRPPGQRQQPGRTDAGPFPAHPLRPLLAAQRVGPDERHPHRIDGRRRPHVVPRLRPGAQRRDASYNPAGRQAAGGRRGRIGRRVARRRSGPARAITETGIDMPFAQQLWQRKRAGPGQHIFVRFPFSWNEWQFAGDGTASVTV